MFAINGSYVATTFFLQSDVLLWFLFKTLDINTIHFYSLHFTTLPYLSLYYSALHSRMLPYTTLCVTTPHDPTYPSSNTAHVDYLRHAKLTKLTSLLLILLLLLYYFTTICPFLYTWFSSPNASKVAQFILHYYHCKHRITTIELVAQHVQAPQYHRTSSNSLLHRSAHNKEVAPV